MTIGHSRKEHFEGTMGNNCVECNIANKPNIEKSKKRSSGKAHWEMYYMESV